MKCHSIAQKGTRLYVATVVRLREFLSDPLRMAKAFMYSAFCLAMLTTAFLAGILFAR